jgi:hypothetical protein
MCFGIGNGPEVTSIDYEYRQRGFHAALCASPPLGFIDSFSVGVSNAPWVASSEAYEDWYLVQDFGALGLLNEAAVCGTRAQPHDVAASVAAGGAGGLYGLRCGTALRRPRYAHWFCKQGVPYRELFAQLAPVVDRVEGALVIPLRQTWPELANKGMEPTR